MRQKFSSTAEANAYLRRQERESVRIHPKAVILDKYVKFNLGKIGVGAYSVIGKIGFGFESLDGKTLKRINHVGKVILEDDVEVGALCAIDRSKLPEFPTRIMRGTKFDNCIHVAHNTVIGEYNLICAGVIFGGSITSGVNCFFGLQATIKDHVKIGNNCIIGQGANVIDDVPDGSVVAGNPARILRKVVVSKDPLPLMRIV